jgi:Protein of unknown function (DUF2442)
MSDTIRVLAVEPRAFPIVHVTFTNGEERDIDLTKYIASGPIFERVRNDPAYFRSVQVEGGTIAWPNGADVDPDVLYYDLGPNATEEAWRAARNAHLTAARP